MPTNEYDSVVKDQNIVANEYDAVVLDFNNRRKTDLRSSISTALQSNPDQYAKARQLSQRTGVPAEVVERNVDEVDQREKVNEYDTLLQNSPALQQQMRSPEFAKLAHDDLENASVVESAVYAFNNRYAPTIATAKFLGKMLYVGAGPDISTGTYGVLQGLTEAAAVDADRFLKLTRSPRENKLNDLAQYFARKRREAKAYGDYVVGDMSDAGVIERGVTSGIRSIGVQTPAILGSLATGNPVPALVFMGSIVGGQEFGDARDAGVPLDQAATYGVSQGLIEILTEKIPVGRLFGDLAKDTGLFKTIINQLTSEIPGEQAATVLQDLNQWAVLHPDKPFGDYLRERPSAAAETLIATMVATGGQTTAIHAADRAFSEDKGRADSALEDLQRLTNLANAAAESKLKGRAADSFEQFVNEASAEGDVQDVYVEAKILAETLEQSGVSVEDVSPAVAKQLEEALAVNGDVRIPLGEYASRIAGQDFADALLPHLRVDPEAMSAAEAEVFNQGAAEQFRQEAENALAQQDDAAATSAENVKANLLEQLTKANRFTKDVNEAYSTLVGDFYTVAASRLGITPEELYAKYPLGVTSESVEGPQAIDQSRSVTARLAEGAEQDATFNQDAFSRPEDVANANQAVDENGNPVVVYRGEHGAPGEGTFQTRSGSLTFVDNAATASLYTESPNNASDVAVAPRVPRATLNIANPAVNDPVDPFVGGADLVRIFGEDKARELIIKHADGVYGGSWDEAFGSRFDSVEELFAARPDAVNEVSTEWYRILDDAEAVELMKAAGFDGAIYAGSGDSSSGVEYRVFDESQVIQDAPADQSQITNPIEPSLSDDEKLARISELTDENQPIVDKFLEGIDLAFGTESKSNRKTDENIVKKARRATVVAKKPWHDIEHVRDAFRFKTVLNDVNDLAGIVDQLVQQPWVNEIVKFDSEKMIAPQEWGWRIISIDLRMNNGQIVEYYFPLRELEDVKDVNHNLFEKWRNEDPSGFDAEQIAEYVRDSAESKERYQAAYEAYQARTSQDDSAVLASLNKAEISSASKTAASSSGSSAVQPADQTSSTLVAANPSESPTRTSEPSRARDAIATALDIGGSSNDNDTLAQAKSTSQSPRGQIKFTEAGATIALLKNADLSTFLHEAGHFFLEVYGDLAALPDAPQGITDDFNALLKWFGVADVDTWQSMSLEARRDSHEKFARGFEAYLFEGKAPSQGLDRLFARFRAWMSNVYRSLTSLNVEITDEVRGVMDRMLAADDAIKSAESARKFAPLFATAEDAGMTDQEFDEYQNANANATSEATEQLTKRTLRDMRWLSNAKNKVLKELQKDVKQKRAAIRDEVAGDVGDERVYRLRRFLSTGEVERDGEVVKLKVHKLSLQALEEMFPDSAVDYDQLTRGKRGVTRKGGLQPELVAEMLGYTSPDHMIRELVAAPPINDVIEARTDQVTLERYGDITDELALEKAAEEAIHSEARARFVASEIRTLNRLMNQREKSPRGGSVNVTLKAAKEFAQQTIARLRIRDVRPAQFARAESRAATAADRELKAGNTLGAATEKRNQLVAGLATKYAHDAVNEVDKGVRYLTKFLKDNVRKNLDVEYVDQIDALLERFDFKRRTLSARDLAKRASLAQWIEDQREQGFEPAIDPAMEAEAFQKPYKEMTVEELRGLIDAVRNIEHLGRLKKKLLTTRKERAFAESVDEATQSIEDNARKTVPEELEHNAFGTRIKAGVKEFFAMHRKLASILRQMDGFKDAGVMWELFMEPLNNAGNKEAVMREAATIELTKLFKSIKNLREKVYIPAIGKSLSREGRLSIALNWGNKTNRLRVMEGDNWTEGQAQAILDTLTKSEWEFVQSIWDYIDSYWKDISAKETRVTGLRQEKVEADPVQTKFGEFKGGYYPIAYDPLRSSKAEADSVAETTKNMLRGLYTRASTRRGHTKARVESVKNRPVRKDIGVIFKHLNEVIHDLSYHEVLIDTNRLLRAKSIDRAIRDSYGPEFLTEIRNSLSDIAAGDTPAEDAWERAIHHLRVGATIAGLGWNLTTGLLQPLGLTQSMVRIGPKYVGKGLARWLGSASRMENSTAWIHEKSPFMRLRHKTMQREINEVQNQIKGNEKLTPVKTSFFYLIQQLQRVADIPTWLGAYEKAMEQETDEQRAIALADQAVIDAQGGGQEKDLARIQRGGPMRKLWTNFYSFFNTTYNLSAESVGRTDFKKPADIGRLAVDYLLLYTLPASLAYFLRLAMKGGDDDDELAEGLVRENLGFMLGTVVGLRELSSPIQGFSYSGTAGARALQEVSRLIQQGEQGEVDAAFLKALNATGGILFHYPAGQVQRTTEGAVQLIEGETDNPFALVAGPSR